MEAETLTICVMELVEVREGTAPDAVTFPHASPYFKPEFRFTINKDTDWAPTRSRAPSVTIDFDFLSGDFS